MSKESLLRLVGERVTNATLASFSRHPMPFSAHQAAAGLYDAVDAYADAVNKNQNSAAKAAAEKLAVEAMRTLAGYEMPTAPQGVENVKVEASVKASKKIKV